MARFILTRVALHLTILMEYFIEYIWDEKIELYWYLKLEVFLVKSIFQRWRCWPELFNSILWKIYMWNFLWFTVKYVILRPRFFIWIFLKLYKWKGWCITLLNIVNINFIWSYSWFIWWGVTVLGYSVSDSGVSSKLYEYVNLDFSPGGNSLVQYYGMYFFLEFFVEIWYKLWHG